MSEGGINDETAGQFRRLSVIVPVFNERSTVAEIVRRMRSVELPLEREIMVVDDGSDDGTAAVLTQLRDSTVRVLRHPQNRGKGAAIRTGLESGERRNMLFLHWVGNRFLSLVTNVLYNSTLSDMETCYKLFDRRVLDGVRLEADRFDFEPEFTAKVLRRGIRIYEVPISYAGRELSEGKKITWQDGATALWTLVKYRFVD